MKILTFLSVILLIIIRPVFAQEVEAQKSQVKLGSWNLSIGFEAFGGSDFYLIEDNDLTAVNTTIGIPKEDKMSFSTFSFRISKMSPITAKGLLAGIEIGMGIPLSGHTYEETVLNSSAQGNKYAYRYDDIYNPSSILVDPPEPKYSQNYTSDLKVAIFPLTGKFAVEADLSPNTEINFAINAGGYILSVTETKTIINSYVSNSSPYKAGDTYKKVNEISSFHILPGVEFSMGMDFSLGKGFSLGLGGRLGYIVEGEVDYHEVATYYPKSHSNFNDTYETLKFGRKIGGFIYNGFLNLKFIF